MKAEKNFHFVNWAKNFRSQPSDFFLPEREEDIIQIVKQAVKDNRKIRVIGGGHSWSDIACSNEFMISLDKYSRVLNIDKDKKQITVQAGIRLKHLNKILEENNLALVNLGSISEQSIAGAIATGTHGTGIRFGNISTQVVGMKVIKGDGSILIINEDSPRNWLSYFRVSLGMLGIITEVTIQCTEKFLLEEIAAPMNFEIALKQLPDLLSSNEHLKLWWFPHVDELQVYRYNRTDKTARPFSAMEAWFKESFMAKFVFTLLLEIGSFLPNLVPRINGVIKMLHFQKINRVDISYRVFNVPMPPRHRECEYAIPSESAAVALSELKTIIDGNDLKVNFVVEARFVKADDAALSPCFGRDTCYIGAYLYGERSWKKYIDLFEELMEKYNGRPHWGKEFFMDESQIKDLYPHYQDFLDFREICDPNRIFTNAYTDRVIG